MNKKELVEKLSKYPDDMEVRVINFAIDDNEACPTFDVLEVSSNKEDSEEETWDDKEDVDFIYIHTYDEEYVADEFLFDVEELDDDVED